jgi:hypothetical protein
VPLIAAGFVVVFIVQTTLLVIRVLHHLQTTTGQIVIWALSLAIPILMLCRNHLRRGKS